MSQNQVEVILMKQVASYLATPIFVVDPIGNLLYYNEPAELLLGRRYDETGEMPMEEWSTIFVPTDAGGVQIPPGQLPLSIAVQQKRPAHGDMHITGLDGVSRHIVVTAFPLIGQGERDLGAVAVVWEASS